METIKSFTSLEQAKILEKILQPKSADMYYHSVENEYGGGAFVATSKVITNGFKNDNFYIDDIPCWSLAALLSVLPPYLFEFDRGIDLNVYLNLNGKGWHCSYMPNCIENMKTDKFKLITSGDSLVDACYEMVLKLHELKVL